MIKVGDKVTCNEEANDFFLSPGEIAYVADIVDGVQYPYYVVKDKSLIGTSHWNLHSDTYTLLNPYEIEKVEEVVELDIVEIVTENDTHYVELDFDKFFEEILDHEWHVFDNVVDIVTCENFDYIGVESRPSEREQIIVRADSIISITKMRRFEK